MLSWEFPPRIIGGIASHVRHLSKALADREVFVHVITCDFPRAPAEEAVEGVRISRVDSGHVPQSNFLLWIYHLNSQMVKRADEILSADKFDLLHAHDWLVGKAAIELKAHYGLPLVTTIHATEVGRGGAVEGEYRKKVHVAEHRLAENSERVICCSNYMIGHLQNTLSVSPERIHVIPNGVDMSRFRANRKTIETQNGFRLKGGKTILFVGRLVKEKGVLTLLEAFHKLRQSGNNSELVIVGDGPMREELAKEAARRGIDKRVTFTGFVDEATLVSAYRSSDVFVLPSLYEPFGMVALEAMASGTPVVVSDVGGLSEIVEDGHTGLKVRPGDPTQLAEALARALVDARLARRLKANGYQMARERYGWDMVGEKTLSVYEQALSQAHVESDALADEDFLGDGELLHLLLVVGATEQQDARSARDIARAVGAPEIPVKLILGRHVSAGYVSAVQTPSLSDVRYHLTETGIVRVCSDFS